MGSRLPPALVVILVCIQICYSVYSANAYGQPVSGLQETTVKTKEGTEYQIQYAITGGSLKEIITQPETATLTVLIQAESDGELQIQFPKNLMMESSIGELTEMIVFVDEIEEFAQEEFSNCERILKVSFPKGAEQIDFVGTFLGPVDPPDSIFRFPINPTIKAGGMTHHLRGVANADHCDFSFDQDGLRIDLEGPFDRPGYLELRIPHKLLAGPYSVFINGVLAQDVDMHYGVSPEGESTNVTIEYIGACTQSIDIVERSNDDDPLPASNGSASGQGGIFVESKPPVPVQKRSLDLVYNVTHNYGPHQDSEGPATRLHLELVDNCTNEPAQFVTFMISIIEANSTETEEPILQDLFHTESGIINLEIVDDGDPRVRIFGTRDDFISAWKPDDGADSVTIKTSAIRPEGSYRMDVQLYSVDNIRNINTS